MAPFDLLPPLAPDRRGREPEANAWIELHNIIVAAEQADDFGPHTVDRIRRQRGVDLRVLFLEQRVELYQRYLDWLLSDGALTADERELMAHLADTLDLAPVHLRDAHRRAFGTVVHDALADDCLDVEERLLLYTLQHTLGLDPDLADGAFEVMARERLLVTVARVLCDGELSPEEAAEVAEAQHNLGVWVPEPVQEMLDGAAARWRQRRDPGPARPTAAPASGAATSGTAGGPRYVVRAVWREVNLSRLRTLFGRGSGEDVLASGDTFHYRVPGIALRGVRQRGRLLVFADRLVFAADGREPLVRSGVSLRRTLRFSNGVVAEFKGDRAVFLETDADGDLHRSLETLLRQRPAPPVPDREVWSARWIPFYASHRDRLIRKAGGWADPTERWRSALKLFNPAGGWSPPGEAIIRPDVVTLHGTGARHTISRDSLRDVHRHGRRIWLDRRGGHDWVLELLSDAEAEGFAQALL